MARPRTDEDTLEPILPKSPPVAPEPGSPPVAEAADVEAASLPGRPAWERWLLLGCAVVATLALVVCALRLNAIAEDERLQACQARVYVEAQLESGRGFNPTDSSFREQLGACIGVDPSADTDGAED